MTCPLCTTEMECALWHDPFCRVVLIEEPNYPGFCRVILNQHVAEMSDLSEAERQRLMRVVFAVETVLRGLLNPDKINLASLGNVVPHVHWHVIPRFLDDAHFPQPIWGPPVRAGAKHPAPETKNLISALADALNVL